MLTFSIYYPYSETARFDMDYYLEKHMPLVRMELDDFGLEKVEILFGQPDIINKHPNFIAVANLYFPDAETMKAALRTKGGVLVSDIRNFTDITPTQEIAVVQKVV